MQMSKTEMPSIRFYGFDNDWEQRKLGELALFNPKDELPQTFEYVDLESVVGTEMLSHRTEVKSSAPSRAQRLAHTGDLFYQTVRPYQKNNYLFEKPDNNYVFSTGYAQMRPYVDGYFLLSLVQSERFVKVVLDNCTGTSYPAINANDLAEIEVAAPSNESEAQKIGTIFRSIDHLITLHQRKFEKLTNVKKSMLEKMFPQNGSCYPEIRFKGFTDPWEQRKFGEVFMSLQNNTLSRAELNDEIGAAQNIHYGDVLIKYDEILDVSKEPLSYIEKQSIADKFKTSYLQNGDVIIADTAEDETVGKCTEIEGLTDQKVISGLHTMPVRPNRKFAFGFLGFYLNSAAYHDQLKPLMQGIKVTSISKGAMQDTVVKFPLDLKEQEQIGIYFGGLDNLITLHQRELEKLQSIKKALLEKMFV
jgi:type I restriction enzyme S subunit